MPISKKQRQILAFSRTSYDALICDGAIRTGKTVFMTIAFVDDAMRRYSGRRFGICGKTVGSATKNILAPYRSLSYANRRYRLVWRAADKELVVYSGRKFNTFEVFGGHDASSQDLIQGRTLAGVLFDEVALQPQSFVEQGIARCSVEGAKLWFNCNPESPGHWFYKEWVCNLTAHNAFRLHFLLDDNPALSEKKKAMYRSSFSGLFYRRFILGEWVMAEGAVYPDFDKARHIVKTKPRAYSRYYVSCDYGTTNPMSIGLWGMYNKKWYRVADSYFDSRKEQRQRTDEEHYAEMDRLIRDNIPQNQRHKLQAIIVDPSAASFIQCVKRHRKYQVKPGNNSVTEGIANVATELSKGTLLFNDCCHEIFTEFESYVWDSKAAENGEDRPIKQNDHAMDDMRYFVQTILYKKTGMTIGGV